MGKPNRGRVTGEYGYAGFFTYPQAKPYVVNYPSPTLRLEVRASSDLCVFAER
jgi:hypothetical protein